MHLRRALLLFAIVIGLAALVASISEPGGGDDEPQPATSPAGKTPSAGPGPEPASLATVRFKLGMEKESKRLEAGRAAIVSVEVPSAGQVELEGIASAQSAEPLTPARFDVLAPRSGSYAVVFTPASDDERRVVGKIVVSEPRSSASSPKRR